MQTENAVRNCAAGIIRLRRWCAVLAGLCLLAWSAPPALLVAQVVSPEGGGSVSLAAGQKAPDWKTQGWVNSGPLDIAQLRGKVVLLRFITDEDPVPSLNELDRAYRARGLAVVAIYVPSPMPSETSLEHVRQLATERGYEFPVALDSRWETLNRYWLDRVNVELTVATFLIGRDSVIRYIQADGQYDKNSPNRALRRGYTKLEKEIEILLKTEQPSAAGKTEPRKAGRMEGHFRPRGTYEFSE